MVLMAVLMCVNFTSCGEPAEVKNESGIVISGKKLVKMVLEDDEEPTTVTFIYDEQGRLTKVGSGTDSEDQINFKWHDNNKIEVCGVFFYEPEHDIILENGLVQDCYHYEFTYNESNRLIEAETPYTFGDFKVTWNNDKLMSIEEDEEITNLTYEKNCKNGYNPLIVNLVGFMSVDNFLFIAHPEIVGIRSKQLPISLTTKDGSALEFQYEMEDGYISKVKINQRHAFTFVWEDLSK